MNLPTRQKQTPDIKNRRVAAKAGLGGGWRGSLGWQMQTLTFRMDKQQGTGFSGGSVVTSTFFTLPGGSAVKNPLRCGRRVFDPGVEKIPWRRKWQPTPVFLPGKSHGLYMGMWWVTAHGVEKESTLQLNSDKPLGPTVHTAQRATPSSLDEPE